MPEVTRRTLLAFTAVASVVEPTFAEGEGASPELRALIGAHEATYVGLHRVVHQAGSSSNECKTADRIEQEALLAICSYPAISRGDRWAKADYLLIAEARDELDLEEHMQAILHSMKR
ncbi:hypothetical protein NKI38_20425 [Mesorhizobium sp. M0621]|uniref:hypothetical protein n=1 Tax=Mesorhizobium sp. M0621 TaxID=2956974 RepID=UPI003335FD25